jgi:hypothetical protein
LGTFGAIYATLKIDPEEPQTKDVGDRGRMTSSVNGKSCPTEPGRGALLTGLHFGVEWCCGDHGGGWKLEVEVGCSWMFNESIYKGRGKEEMADSKPDDRINGPGLGQ